jgi:nitrate/nitrite-specific signal transduction histidine kinase
LLQETQGLVLRFEAVARRIPKDDPLRQQMDSVLERADDVVVSARERVVRFYEADTHWSDLAPAFADLLNKYAPHASTRCSIIVDGVERALRPHRKREIYRLGREVILDAWYEGRARQVEVEITHARDYFRLRIRDDGHCVASSSKPGEGSRHIARLVYVHQQATTLGATLVVWGRKGLGTEIDFNVPSSIAYARQASSCYDKFRHFVGGR